MNQQQEQSFLKRNNSILKNLIILILVFFKKTKTTYSLQGIVYLNSIQIWHRDIKAANILLTDSGNAKLGKYI